MQYIFPAEPSSAGSLTLDPSKSDDGDPAMSSTQKPLPTESTNNNLGSTAHWFFQAILATLPRLFGTGGDEADNSASQSTNKPSADIAESSTTLHSDLMSVSGDWEYILSRSEEVSRARIEVAARWRELELERLRKQSAHLADVHKFFLRCAQDFISSLSPEDQNALKTPLDASKRSKIISDVISQCTPEWLNTARRAYFLGNDELWDKFKTTYGFRQKEDGVFAEADLTSSMASLSLQASQGPRHTGLNARILSDILWSMWKPFNFAISLTLGRPLKQEENFILLNVCCFAEKPLVTLWSETAKNSKRGTEAEGKIVELWKVRDEQERQRIEAIKKRGVDARYEPKEHDHSCHNRAHSIESVRNMIEQKLLQRYRGY